MGLRWLPPLLFRKGAQAALSLLFCAGAQAAQLLLFFCVGAQAALLLLFCAGAQAALLLLFCVGAQAAPTAATPMFRHFGVDDGQPSSIVYKLAEDRDGFVWIGTHDGLARYDGVHFRVWRAIPGDDTSIAGNEVSALYVDRANRVWAGGEGSGLNLLDESVSASAAIATIRTMRTAWRRTMSGR